MQCGACPSPQRPREPWQAGREPYVRSSRHWSRWSPWVTRRPPLPPWPAHPIHRPDSLYTLCTVGIVALDSSVSAKMAVLRRLILAALAGLTVLTLTVPAAMAQPVSYVNSIALPQNNTAKWPSAVVTYGNFVFVGTCECWGGGGDWLGVECDPWPEEMFINFPRSLSPNLFSLGSRRDLSLHPGPDASRRSHRAFKRD